MKNLFKSIASVAIVAMAFAGCSKEATDVTAPITKKGVTVRFNAEVIDETRATLTPDESEKTFAAAWNKGDSIGITVKSNAVSDQDLNISGTWENDAFSATFQNCKDAATTWTYHAYYPYTAEVDKDNYVTIPLGKARTQSGNSYNSKYDVMVADSISINSNVNVEPGKDENGKSIVFPMHRLTSIAYFHFTTDKAELQNEKVVSVTLTVDDDKYIAADIAMFCYTDATPVIIGGDGETNSIELTYDEANRPTANDFTAWFNLLPVDGVTSVAVEIETENYVATIERKTTASALNYEAGKLYKVSGKISDDKWEATSADYSGTYLIVEPTGDNTYWYMSPNIADSTKPRLTAISSESATFDDATDEYAWVIKKSNGKYTIQSYTKGTYVCLVSGQNYADLVEDISSAEKVIITKNEKTGTFTIEGVSQTRYLCRNKDTRNKYFAFYTSSQTNNGLTFVPYYSKERLAQPVVTATATNEGTIELSWEAVANAGSYTIKYQKTSDSATATPTEATVTTNSYTFNVEEVGQYTISVVANPSDTDSYKASAAATATATIIGNPASAKISSISANALTASWDAVDGAASYNWIVRNGDNEVKSGNLAGTTLSLTDITLVADTEYVLYVKSVATAPQGSLATFTQSEPNLYSENPIIKVAQSAIEVDADQATGTIAVTAENVTADAQFAVQCSAEFITATLSDDHTTLSYTIAANDTGAERTGTITITLTEGAHSDSAEISVTQTANAGTTVTMETFSAVSGNMDSNISYTSAKGTAGTVPGVYNNQIRLYQNGGKITITAKTGHTLSSVTIGSDMKTKIAYTIGDSTTKSTTEDLAKGGKKTVDNIDSQSITFYCMGTTSSTRLYVNYLSVTYK